MDINQVAMSNAADYSSIKSIKRLYRNIETLRKLASNGNSSALAINLDLTLSYKHNSLTPIQQQYIKMHLIERDTVEEIAKDRQCSEGAVNITINRAVAKIILVLKSSGFLNNSPTSNYLLQTVMPLIAKENKRK